MSRLSGMNMRFTLGDMKLKANKFTLDITDNSATVFTQGIPDGWVDGSVEGSGEIELNTTQFNLVMKLAANAGSFRALPAFDAMGFGKVGNEELKVEMFGLKLKLTSILNVDAAGGSAFAHKIPFEITSSDFIKINGVSYLRPDETDGFE